MNKNPSVLSGRALTAGTDFLSIISWQIAITLFKDNQNELSDLLLGDISYPLIFHVVSVNCGDFYELIQRQNKRNRKYG